ncbi:MAG: hypothetical protein RLZZ480_904 [Candidatus Parcubacteria bacterium]|jgi:hypothetical protein
MNSGENKRKHLQLIQDVITRMGGNSFLLKGWSISIITALVGFALTSDSEKDRAVLLIIAMVLVLMFWLLDSYYLSQERMYRGLFGEVRKKNEDQIDYSLDARHHNTGYNTWTSAMTSHVFLIFYVPVLLILLLVCSNLIGINVYIK